MKPKKIFQEILFLEKQKKDFLKGLSHQKILQSQAYNYTHEEKLEFLSFWGENIYFFKQLITTIKKIHYRSYLFFIDYNKLVLKRYLIIVYFNLLADILDIFWVHEEYIRTLLDEEFKYSYWKMAHFLYKPYYLSLLNIPSTLLKIKKYKIKKKYQVLLAAEKNIIGNNKRIITDYKNIYFYIKRRVLKILFFTSKHLGHIIAKTKFTSRKHWLISHKNLSKYLKIASHWDILLSRGNWNASNITIPWFWKHMSLYLGNGKYLKKHFCAQYDFVNTLADSEHYIIEATWAWVKIVDIKEFAARNDYLAASRTKFTKEKILASIKTALSYYGAWYDHLFNFYSDKAVVCSELVLKSYSQRNQKDEWLDLHLEKIWLSLTYPPNNFINEIFHKDSQLQPILFIDSIEKTHKNFVAPLSHLKYSWKRSRFSFLLD